MEKARVRNARAEAAAMLGPGEDSRVLEPSPPAVAQKPWFADDPTEGMPLDWSSRERVDPAWRRERWLGPYTRLAELPAAFATTREALHELAAGRISPAREAANGKIGLRWTLGGFGTPFFAADEQLRLEHGVLVHQRGGEASGEQLGVDVAAASALGEFYGFATSVLEALRAGAAPLEPSRVQLWPEHFDVSVEIGPQAAGSRAGYGASPGDEGHPEPYLYVLPWGEVPVGERWRATDFAGAELRYGELLGAADQRALALTFFGERLAELQAR
jgi:hypothetical protein